MTLRDQGDIDLTAAAIEAYADHMEIDDVTRARRELLLLLRDAKRIKDARNGQEQWRVRSRPFAVDITAQVAYDANGDPVVTHCHCRRYKVRER